MIWVTILFLILLLSFFIIINNLFNRYFANEKKKFEEVLKEYKNDRFDINPSHILLKGNVDAEELMIERDHLKGENDKLNDELRKIDYNALYPVKVKIGKKQYKENDQVYVDLRLREKYLDSILKTETEDRRLLELAYRDIVDLLYLIDK